MERLTDARNQLESLAKTKLPILSRRRWPWSKDEQQQPSTSSPTQATQPISPSESAPVSTPPSPLCQQCSKLDLESMLVRETVEQPLGSLSNFTSPECPFCSLISESISFTWGADWNTAKLCSALATSPKLFMQSRSPLSVKAVGAPVARPQPRLLLAVDQIPKDVERTAVIVNKEIARIKNRNIIAEIECLSDPTGSGTSSEGSYLIRREVKPKADVALAKQWLAVCKAHKHSKASQTDENSDFLFQGPGFRLIDVENVCLVQMTTRCDYIALSYVWGAVPTLLWRDENSKTNPILLTLKDNVQRLVVPGGLSSERVEELEGARLPTTVQDAMEFTRRIGMRYLWVDTLCIVQNDLDDKARLIGSMDDVYASGTATLIAAGGIDADAGLHGVGHRSGIPLRPARIPRRSGQGHLDLSVCLISLSETVRSSKWHTRGWTYQEQALSQRCIYFTPDEMFFNCSESQFREGYSIEANKCKVELRTGPPWWTRNLRKDPDPTPYKYLGDPHSLGAEEYQAAVEDYMMKDLTFPDDILNAFEGVFNRFSGAERDTRLGIRETQGIPAHLLYLGLLWFPSQKAKKRPDLAKPIEGSLSHFASWSWASWIGPVDFVFGESAWISRNISYALRKRLTIHVPIVSWYLGGSNHREWAHHTWTPPGTGSNLKSQARVSQTKEYLTKRIGVDIEQLQGQGVSGQPADLLFGELGFVAAFLPAEKVTLRAGGKGVRTITSLDHKGEFRFDGEPGQVDEFILIVSADTIKQPPDTQSTILGVCTRDGISRRVGIGFMYHSKEPGSALPEWDYMYFRLH